jgi:hypothetical protein
MFFCCRLIWFHPVLPSVCTGRPYVRYKNLFSPKTTSGWHVHKNEFFWKFVLLSQISASFLKCSAKISVFDYMHLATFHRIFFSFLKGRCYSLSLKVNLESNTIFKNLVLQAPETIRIRFLQKKYFKKLHACEHLTVLSNDLDKTSALLSFQCYDVPIHILVLAHCCSV